MPGAAAHRPPASRLRSNVARYSMRCSTQRRPATRRLQQFWQRASRSPGTQKAMESRGEGQLHIGSTMIGSQRIVGPTSNIEFPLELKVDTVSSESDIGNSSLEPRDSCPLTTMCTCKCVCMCTCTSTCMCMYMYVYVYVNANVNAARIDYFA